MAPRSAPQAVYAHRSPRWPHLISLLGAAILTAVAIRVLFFGLGEIESPIHTREWGFASVVGIGALVGLSLCVGFAYRLLRNPPTLRLYEEGFEYSPAGVSTGLIRWSDVVELRNESVLVSMVGTPARRPVTAVVLRNPEDYERRFPAALRPVFALNRRLNSSPILITPGEFGPDHDAILAVMRENVAKATDGARS
ncbi:MAG TPA: STM3941 family protein [Acidobacteriota bacterium]|nr:STM3941 family protein [Acidobacteriota bacterium]